MRIACFIIAVSFLVSCDRPECRNTNPVLDKYQPESKEYREELVKQIEKRGKDKLNYWIKDYIPVDQKEFMTVWVQDDSLCANMLLDITGNQRLEQYRQVKGVSYSGAGLSGIDYDIINDSNGYQFIFKDVDRIID